MPHMMIFGIFKSGKCTVTLACTRKNQLEKIDEWPKLAFLGVGWLLPGCGVGGLTPWVRLFASSSWAYTPLLKRGMHIPGACAAQVTYGQEAHAATGPQRTCFPVGTVHS